MTRAVWALGSALALAFCLTSISQAQSSRPITKLTVYDATLRTVPRAPVFRVAYPAGVW
jgi:hypothetical protein